MAVKVNTLEKTIRSLLEDKKYQTLKDVLVTMEPADIAGILEELEEERLPLLFRLLPKEPAAESFFGQFASAGGGRVVREAVCFRQFELRFAAAP